MRHAVLMLTAVAWLATPCTAAPTEDGLPEILRIGREAHGPRSPAEIRAFIRYGESPGVPPAYVLLNSVQSSDTENESGRDQKIHDPWLSFDKLQHFTFSFLFTVGSQYTLKNKLDMSRTTALPYSIGSASVIGLLKEVYDWQIGPGRYFSKKDLIANSVGILSATAFILIW